MNSILQQKDEEYKRRLFEEMIEHFIKRYAPEDRYERSEFDRHLLLIVRQIYADAQEPLLKVINNYAAAAVLPFISKKQS